MPSTVRLASEKSKIHGLYCVMVHSLSKIRLTVRRNTEVEYEGN